MVMPEKDEFWVCSLYLNQSDYKELICIDRARNLFTLEGCLLG